MQSKTASHPYFHPYNWVVWHGTRGRGGNRTQVRATAGNLRDERRRSTRSSKAPRRSSGWSSLAPSPVCTFRDLTGRAVDLVKPGSSLLPVGLVLSRRCGRDRRAPGPTSATRNTPPHNRLLQRTGERWQHPSLLQVATMAARCAKVETDFGELEHSVCSALRCYSLTGPLSS
jgi:hypothetical protein